jgi:hypothetical protein
MTTNGESKFSYLFIGLAARGKSRSNNFVID